MGILEFIRKLRSGKKKEIRILLLGLDNAGKTTMLKRLNNEDFSSVTPTTGFNVKTVTTTTGFKLTVFDIGGQESIRPYWRNYFEQADVFVFVIDSNDNERLAEAGKEFKRLLDEEKLANVPVLVMANKQDMETAEKPDQIATLLNLTQITDHNWQIQPCSAISGDGIQNGIQWACNQASQ